MIIKSLTCQLRTVPTDALTSVHLSWKHMYLYLNTFKGTGTCTFSLVELVCTCTYI